MTMFFAKFIASLSLAALVAANLIERDVPTTCNFVMTPTPDLGAATLQASINYAVGHTVGAHWPGKTLQPVNEPLVRRDDGTYEIQSSISVDGVATADVKAFVNTWAGTTLDGLNAQWQVSAASCA